MNLNKTYNIMIQKFKVYKRYFQRFYNQYSKRKLQSKEYRKNELNKMWDGYNDILNPDHYSHVEFDGFRYNQALLEKYILEKRKLVNSQVRNIFDETP
jgi:anaerobic selenocysteine-containing dehydrogenase